MQFVDEAELEVIGGNGGNGCRSFRREKYVPRGGPNGGSGGHGGQVVVRADEGLTTLADVRSRRQLKATRGDHGRGKMQQGACGEDCVLRLPVGTVITDAATGLVLADLTAHQEEAVVAKGGRGGRGNMHFKSSTNQAPDSAEPGEEGETRRICLELKLLADVGLIGLPNAGKSTLLAAISHARPKIADYPFTTKIPNLGVVRLGIDRSFTVADIPGLIEGASLGVGLGHQFLRHIERTRVLVHCLDLADPAMTDPIAAYRMVREELAAFDPGLLTRPEVVLLTKHDLPVVQEGAAVVMETLQAEGATVVCVSAADGTRMTEGLNAIWHTLTNHDREAITVSGGD
jgi:GTPase